MITNLLSDTTFTKQERKTGTRGKVLVTQMLKENINAKQKYLKEKVEHLGEGIHDWDANTVQATRDSIAAAVPSKLSTCM